MTKEEPNKSGFELTSNSPDDPRMHKSWGYITALPSEYLIHFQGGKIKQKSSGQGATCFKWARDTVFIVPTSLKEILFDASQLTSDNVDIRIHCMANIRYPTISLQDGLLIDIRGFRIVFIGSMYVLKSI